MFLLVPAHPGSPGQSSERRKVVVCVCVCVFDWIGLIGLIKMFQLSGIFVMLLCLNAVCALTLLVGWQEGHSACKT